MFDFLSKIDLSKADETTVEALKTLQTAIDAAFGDYLSDKIDQKSFDLKIAEVIKQVDSSSELETLRKELGETKEALIRVKSSLEKKGGSSEVVVKSIDQQIEEQLKDFITIGKNGEKSVDLKTCCKQAPGYKKSVTVVVNRKAVDPVVSTGVAPHYNMTIDNTLSVEPRAQTFIRRYANVAGISTRSLTYAEFDPGDQQAEWVPEKGLKPMMSGTLAEVTINAGKVALGAKVSEETMSDLPQLVAEIRAEIISRIGLKEEEGILTGTGADGQIKGIEGSIPGFSLTNLKVEKANTYDVIVAGYTQIVSMSNMAYRPNLVLMHPLDYAQMQLTKDLNGQYLRPFRIGDELIQGLRVETSTAVEQGEIWIGDFNYLNIRDLWVLTITFGWENDDFTRNMVTMLGEKRLMVYIKKQYITAFVKDSIKTIQEAITPTVVGG